MDRKETITLLQLQRGMRLIGVRFLNEGRDGSTYPSKQYHYKCAFPVSSGDLVVVEAGDRFQVGSVGEVDVDYTEVQNLGALRHVVDVVNLARHAGLKMEERQLHDLVVRGEMQQKLAELAATPVFRALMDAPTPILTAISAAGTRHDSETGEVVE